MSDDEAKEPRLFIVDGVVETATVKRRPTVLEVVLKPEVFVEGGKEYVYENVDYTADRFDDFVQDDEADDVIEATTQGPAEEDIDARLNSSRQLEGDISPTALSANDDTVDFRTLRGIPFQTIEDFLLENMDRIRPETLEFLAKSMMNKSPLCRCQEQEISRAYDPASINKVIQPSLWGNDAGETFLFTAVADPAGSPDTFTTTPSPQTSTDQSDYYPTTTESRIFSILATAKPFAEADTTTGGDESSTYYPLFPSNESQVTYYPVLAPDFEDEQPRSFDANSTSNLIEATVEEVTAAGEELTEERAASSDEIADCISEFLECVDLEEEGSGDSGESSPCYKSFQDCSGSVILVPDLYQDQSTVGVDDGLVEQTTLLPTEDYHSPLDVTKQDP